MIQSDRRLCSLGGGRVIGGDLRELVASAGIGFYTSKNAYSYIFFSSIVCHICGHSCKNHLRDLDTIWLACLWSSMPHCVRWMGSLTLEGLWPIGRRDCS